MRILDTLGFLLGDWRVDRQITDQRSGVPVAFTGMAAYRETAGDRGRYQETGELRRGRYVGRASRILLLQRRADGSAILNFPDGHPFVQLDLDGGRCTGQHLCGFDTYDLDWRAVSPELIIERWRVRGPDKCYDARTLLRRL